MLSHIRYHGVLLWNGVTFDWSSVGAGFGTCSAPGARTWACGLVCPSLFIAQTTWFGMPNFVARNESGWNIVSKAMKYAYKGPRI